MLLTLVFRRSEWPGKDGQPVDLVGWSQGSQRLAALLSTEIRWLGVSKVAASGNDYGDRWIRTMSAEIERYPLFEIDAQVCIHGLIVTGGYGHSRLGEWMFGGVTRGLLVIDKIGMPDIT
jgi:hypothetical protein